MYKRSVPHSINMSQLLLASYQGTFCIAKSLSAPANYHRRPSDEAKPLHKQYAHSCTKLKCNASADHWPLSTHYFRMTAYIYTWAVGVCTIDQSTSTVPQQLTAYPLKAVFCSLCTSHSHCQNCSVNLGPVDHVNT